MEIVEIELRRHSSMVSLAKEVLYDSEHHLIGISSYNDKKRIHDLELKLKEKRELLTINDLQFLQSIHEKY